MNREEEILYQVQQLFPLVDLEQDELHCEESEEAVLRLLDNGVDRLMGLGEVNTTDRFRNINIRKKPKLKIGVSIESDIMNLSVSSDDIAQEDLLQILQSYQRRKKYYRLKNGDLISVSEADMEMLQQMMEAMQLSTADFVKGNMKIIHYDPWWNQAVQNQATDRAHRIGQTKAVSVYKLIVKDTIEEKIVKMQENKKDLADAILSGENGSITQMSKEELMELLEG